jgi:Tfp pilus assembly PilM family ATPase
VEALALVERPLEQPFDPRALADQKQREALARTLGAVVEEEEIAQAGACLGLDRRVALLKRHLLLPGSDHCEQLRWETAQFLDGQSEEFSMDFALMSRWGFAVVARWSALDLYLELAAAAGLEDVDVDVAPFALYNAGECAQLLPGGGLELLVYAGADEACLLLLDEEEPVAADTCCWATAQEEEAVQAIESCARGWLESSSLQGEVQQLWCAGCAGKTWSAALAQRLGASWSLLDPLAAARTSSLETSLEERSAFAIAVGLAQRRLEA